MRGKNLLLIRFVRKLLLTLIVLHDYDTDHVMKSVLDHKLSVKALTNCELVIHILCFKSNKVISYCF